VLIGTLTRAGDQFSLKAELLNVADGKREFGVIIEDSADKILTLRDEMVARVMEKLNLNATPRSIRCSKGLHREQRRI
jgi:TolB-like protein